MAGVRYAIAGSPVEHSLSPLLLAIVHDHLTSIKSKATSGFKVLKLDLVDTSNIEDALAWGYAGSMPNSLPWKLTGAPFGKFRTTALLEKAIAGSRKILDCSPLLESKSTKSLQLQIQEMSEKMQSMADSKLPNSVLNKEIWINLTSPLKHTLVSDAVSTIDNSMEIQSVNCLRWDGQGWFCGTFDFSRGTESLARDRSQLPIECKALYRILVNRILDFPEGNRGVYPGNRSIVVDKIVFQEIVLARPD